MFILLLIIEKLTTNENDEEIGGIFKEYADLANQVFTGAEKFTLKCKL
jgi:hypothetical protein